MKRDRIAWIAAIVVIASITVIHAWFSAFDHDEIQHLHAAWMIGQGMMPFADFLEQHHPTMWYALAPLANAFSSPHLLVFAARLGDLALLAFFIIIFIKLVRRLYPAIQAAWPATLLVASFMFTRNAIEVRPDPLMNLLLFSGLLAWISFLQLQGWRRACVAGLLFGAAVAVLQKALVIVGLVALSSLPLALIHRRNRQRWTQLLFGTAAMTGCITIPILVLFALMFEAGIGEKFLFWNYAYNKLLYLTAEISAHFPIVATLSNSLAHNAILWIAGTAGAAIMAIKLWRKRSSLNGTDDAIFVILFASLGYALFLARSRFPFSQYFLPLLPLLALASGEVFLWARLRRSTDIIMKCATVAMAIELIVIMLLYAPNAPQRTIQELILSQTSSDDAVFIPPPYHPIFRHDGSYFWYNGAMIAGVAERHAPASKEVLRAFGRDDILWSEQRPQLVFIDPDETDYHPYRWGERGRDYESTGIPGLYRLKR